MNAWIRQNIVRMFGKCCLRQSDERTKRHKTRCAMSRLVIRPGMTPCAWRGYKPSISQSLSSRHPAPPGNGTRDLTSDALPTIAKCRNHNKGYAGTALKANRSISKGRQAACNGVLDFPHQTVVMKDKPSAMSFDMFQQ